MNIKQKSCDTAQKINRMVNFSESQQNFGQQSQMQQRMQELSPEEHTMETVLRLKSLQFNFDSGVIMAKINVNIDSKFGLKWHAENAENAEKFIESVSNFVGTTGNILSVNDKQKLEKQYNLKLKLNG